MRLICVAMYGKKDGKCATKKFGLLASGLIKKSGFYQYIRQRGFMSGCIKFNKDSYDLTVNNAQNVNVFVDGVVVPTSMTVRRSQTFHRLGKDYNPFLAEKASNSSEVARIRNIKIALDRLKDTSNICFPFK